MTARLPIPGEDSGTWGDTLNTFLQVGHDSTGRNIGAIITPSITPNSSPQNGETWFSDSIAHLRADPSPASRYPIGVNGQEASVWEYNGVLKILYNGAGLGFISCAGDPTVAANWSAPVNVLGGGVGGYAGLAEHGYLYTEGTTLYYYYVDSVDQHVGVATASLTDAVPSFTNQASVVMALQSGVPQNGNICVVKDGSTYRMFLELLHNDANIYGNASSWQTIMTTASNPLGPFTKVLDPVTSLRPNSWASVSGPDIHQEGNLWVTFLHSGWLDKWPNDIYRATATDLSTDSWTVDNGGFPFMRRAHPFEVDQAADPSFVRRANGMSYLVYTAGNNLTGIFKLMITQLNPSWRRWDGYKWASIQPEQDTPHQQGNSYELRQFLPVSGPSGSTLYTVGAWTLDGTQTPPVQYNSSNAQNDQIEYDVTLPPGNYQVDVFYQKGAANAIIEVDYSTLSVGTIDAYAASGSSYNKATRPLIIRGTETYRRSVRFKAATRNASATGWKIAIHGWQIRSDGPYPNLVLNGDFSEGTTFWGTQGSSVTWSAANNALTVVRGVGQDAQPLQNMGGFEIGKTYNVTFNVAGAGIALYFGGVPHAIGVGTGQSVTWTATSNFSAVAFYPIADSTTAIISNIQVRQVPD